MLSERSNRIIENVLKMNDVQLAAFLKGLTPDTREYLDVILEKHLKEQEED